MARLKREDMLHWVELLATGLKQEAVAAAIGKSRENMAMALMRHGLPTCARAAKAWQLQQAAEQQQAAPVAGVEG